MDRTETYIKQCDCEEIQEHKEKPLDWSGIQEHYYKGAYSYGLLTDGSYTYWTGSHFIWLPRQDQLQEMVFEVNFEYENLAHLAWSFDKFCNGAHPNPFRDNKPFGGDNMLILRSLTSMEQLWLAFVMNELHGKVWTGEKWEKV